MKNSYPKSSCTPITFRCTMQFKEELEIATREFHLNQSEIIRIGTEIVMYMLNNPDSYEKIMTRIDELRQQLESRKEAAAQPAPATEEPSALFSLIERRDDSMRNITRLDKGYSGVDGFRVTIVRRKRKFERVFYDKEYGGIEAAFAAALAVRNYVQTRLDLHPDEFEEVKADVRAMMLPPYPRRRHCISSLIETDES